MVYTRGNLSFKGLKGAYSITYQGQGVSNNKFYSASHWKIRHGIKEKYSKIFRLLLLEKPLPKLEEFQLAIYYKSRHDADNVVAMGKLMLDCLKEERENGVIVKRGWVHDDSSEYLKGISVFHDSTLENNTFEFVILHIK